MFSPSHLCYYRAMSNEAGQPDPELENNPLWQLHRRETDRIIDATELEDWRFYDLRTENRDMLLDAIEQRGKFSLHKQIQPIHLNAIDTDAQELYTKPSDSDKPSEDNHSDDA